MTLATIITNVLNEVGEFESISTFVGNQNRTASQIVAIANTAGRSLRDQRAWQALESVKEFTANGTQAQDSSAFPPDGYRWIINMTLWQDDKQWPVLGPVSAVQWQALTRGTIAASAREFFRLRGNTLYLWPGDSTDDHSYEFASKFWVDTDGDGVGEAETWQSDEDTSLLDEYLLELDIKWRWLAAKELPYAEQYNEALTNIRQAMARDKGRPALSFSSQPLTNLIGFHNIPETGYGA